MRNRLALILGLLSAAVMFGSGVASAETDMQSPVRINKDASASSCIKGYSGPYDLVNEERGISLFCGDPTKGILHIVSGDSHRIDENGADDVNVERCMNNVLAYGEEIGSNRGKTAKEYKYGNTSAIIVWDDGSKNVVTLFPKDNNWAACAGAA